MRSSPSSRKTGSLATIDLDALAAGGAPRSDALALLAPAVRETGAFLVTGSSVDRNLAAEVLAQSRALFCLPPDALAAIDMMHSPHFRGYNAAGIERTGGRPDMREQLDVGPEAPALAANAQPPYLRLIGPNMWPASLPGLRATILEWMDAMHDVALLAFDAVLETIGAPPAAFAEAFAPDPHARVKIVRYPGAPVAEGQGVGEHSDSGLLTVILSDASPGLQVRDGANYIDVAPPAGTLVAVLGRALARATHGATAAARHRVLSPPPGSARISVPYFFNPRLQYAIEPVPMTPRLRTFARPFEDETANAASAEYGYSFLNVLLRSHRLVAERHHPDMLSDRGFDQPT